MTKIFITVVSIIYDLYSLYNKYNKKQRKDSMENKFLESTFLKREKRHARTYLIEADVYAFMVNASIKYQASISDIVNACLAKFIKSGTIKGNTHIYAAAPTRNLTITESNIVGLKKLKRETHLTFTSLINMAVRAIMD